MPSGLAALALIAALAPSWLAVRAPPAAHLSPDGRLMIMLKRDEAFGQIETLEVFADPNTQRAHRIFRSIGDTPLRFLRWRDTRVAELEFPPQGEEPAYRLQLTCGDESCTLDRTSIARRR